MKTLEQKRAYMKEYRRQLKAASAERQAALENDPQHDIDCARIAEILCALPPERLLKLVNEKWGK